MALVLAIAALVADSTSFIRVNQVGYLPDAPKVAVVCSLDSARISTFVVAWCALCVVKQPYDGAGTDAVSAGVFRKLK